MTKPFINHNLFILGYKILISLACGWEPFCLPMKIVCKILWSPKSASELRMMHIGGSTLRIGIKDRKKELAAKSQAAKLQLMEASGRDDTRVAAVRGID